MPDRDGDASMGGKEFRRRARIRSSLRERRGGWTSCDVACGPMCGHDGPQKAHISQQQSWRGMVAGPDGGPALSRARVPRREGKDLATGSGTGMASPVQRTSGSLFAEEVGRSGSPGGVLPGSASATIVHSQRPSMQASSVHACSSSWIRGADSSWWAHAHASALAPARAPRRRIMDANRNRNMGNAGG